MNNDDDVLFKMGINLLGRCEACLRLFSECQCSRWCEECGCMTNHTGPHPSVEDGEDDEEHLDEDAIRDREMESRIERERERIHEWERYPCQ